MATIDHNAASPLEWVVYVLRCNDRSLYCGITNNLERRIKQHRAGTGARYTKGRGPLRVAHWWKVANKSAALRAEYAFKALSRPQKLAALQRCKRAVPPEF